MILLTSERTTLDQIRVVLCRVVVYFPFLFIHDQQQKLQPQNSNYYQTALHSSIRSLTLFSIFGGFLLCIEVRAQGVINNFNQMEIVENGNSNAKEYLTNLLSQHGQNAASNSILTILKEKEYGVTQKLKEGQLEINLTDNPRGHLANHLLKKREINPFQSHYKGFFLNSDREKSHERLQIFKKIKEEYSKEKTALVVKEVEKKIKEWTAKKLEIEKKKQRSREQDNKIQIEMIEHLRRLELERRQAEKEGRKEQLMNRLKLMQQKREQRHNFMKQSSIRSLDVKEPRYKEMEDKFKEIQERIKQEQERLLEQKRQSMIVPANDIEQHSKKYDEILKKKEEQRKNKLKLKLSQQQLENRESFNAFHNELRQKKEQQLSKRKRMKQFQEKVKSVIIIKKKSDNTDNEEEVTMNKSRSIQKSSIDQEFLNEENHKIRRKQRSIVQNADGRKLGNDYLRSLKQKDHEILNNSERRSRMPNSASLPVLKPIYKNYLTQVKIKRRPVGDQIEQLKRVCQNPKEVYQKLNQKSQAYQSSMMKKINELKKINKYDQSVVRESEIDELYSRYIKMRLACISS